MTGQHNNQGMPAGATGAMGALWLRFRAGWASQCVLVLGLALAYPYGPIDLIPNSLPVIGYLDQVGFFIAGICFAYLLLPAPITTADSAVQLPARRAPRSLAGLARGALLDGFALVFARPILRLATGGWPSHTDIVEFRRAFRRFTPLPPLLRALAAVQPGRHQLTRAMLASWLLADEAYRGTLRADLAPPTPGQAGNCLRVWTGPKLTLLHLEKTAGMAVTEVLAAQFHPLQIDADLRRAFPPHVLSPLPPFLLPRVRRCALVWGHYDAPSIRRLGTDRFVITFLRDPRARILSLYYYWRGQAALDLGWNGMNQPVLAAQRLPLAEFLTSDDPWIRNYIDNFYARRLTGLYCGCPHGDPLAADPAAALRQALESLDGFDFVGLTEKADISMGRLGQILGFTPPATLPRVNVTRGAEPAAETVAVEAALDRLTGLDQVIYDRAAARFGREEELFFFEKKNQKTSANCGRSLAPTAGSDSGRQ